MRKYICLIVQNYYQHDVKVNRYVNVLLNNGYYVDVIALSERGMPFIEKQDKFSIFRIGLPKKRGSLIRYFMEYLVFFLESTFLVSILYFKKRYDIIHVNTLPDFLVFSTLFVKLLGAKIILDMHEIAPEFFQVKFNKSENNISIRFLKIIEKLSLSFCDHSLTVTEAIKNIFIKRAISKNKIDVIMNVPDKIVEKETTKLDYSDRFNLVYHGTLTELYSLEQIITALSKLIKRIPHVKLYVYGEGPSKQKLEELSASLDLEEYVSFKDYLPHQQILEILLDMDVGVLPINRNPFIDLSFSNKLGEYVSIGLPVIISKIPSIMYYFSEKSLFYCDNNIDQICDQLEYIFKNPDETTQRISDAKEDILKINWGIMSSKYLKIVESLCKNKHKY